MKNIIGMTLHRIVLFAIVGICLTFTCPTVMAAEITSFSSTIKEDTIFINSWSFYEQLNDTEKLIYESFQENKELLINGKNVDFSIASYNNINEIDLDSYKYSVITAMRAYLADNPLEKIWMDYCELSIHPSAGLIVIKISPQGGIDVQNAMQSVKQISTEFVETLSGTNLEKLQTIHDWLMNNVEYDLTTNNNGNIYGAIVEGHSVCSGFAYSFKYLADQAGLNVIYVQGDYYSPLNATYTYHAWNMAEVDGEWLLIDVTFDSSMGISSLFTWQNTGTHFPDSRFTYPTIRL